MKGKIDILTSGYVSMDRVIKISSPARVGFTAIITNKDNASINFGGCSVNIAYAGSKLGLSTAPLIRVGGDYEDTGFKAFLEKSGVALGGVTQLQEEKTSCCYLIENPDGDHVTLFYPGAMDGKYSSPPPDSLFIQSRLGVMTVGAKADNEVFFEKCRQHDLPMVFGMKSDAEAFPPDFLKAVLAYSRIIFMNEAEERAISEEFGLHSITTLLSSDKTEIVVITCGTAGSRFYRKQDGEILSGRIPACKPDEVIDTSGSGDAYISGFLFAFIQGYSVAECCMAGSVLASFVIEKEGCTTNIPNPEQFMQRLAPFREKILANKE